MLFKDNGEPQRKGVWAYDTTVFFVALKGKWKEKDPVENLD